MDFHAILTEILKQVGIEAGHMLYPAIWFIVSDFLGFSKSIKSNNVPQLVFNIGKVILSRLAAKKK
jgi:hypothetical protein